MSREKLLHLFESSASPDQQLRAQAELGLKQAETEDGFLAALLPLIAQHQNSPLAVAMAVYCKNRVKSAWSSPSSEHGSVTSIMPSDRAFFKAHIVDAVAALPEKLAKLLASCISTVVSLELLSPEGWPQLLPGISACLVSPERQSAGLILLWEVISAFRFKPVDKRAPIRAIIEQTFDSVLNIGSNALASLDSESGSLMHRVLKCYYASVQYELPASMQDPAALVQWGNLFMQVIAKDLPLSSVPEDLDERETWPWWKAKKWAFHCVYLLNGKYCVQPMANKESSYHQFSVYFMANFSPNILDAYLVQVGKVTSGTWMSNRTMQQLSLFLTDCVKHKALWARMKPHMQTLIVDYIFPQLCISDQDLELWASDPTEYVQAKLDPMEDFRSSVAAAQGLLSSIVRSRFKFSFMSIIEFANSVLEAYNNAPSTEQRNVKAKDGVMQLVSSIAPEMMSKKSPIRENIETFLAVNILPELKSPHAFLRARACDTLLHFQSSFPPDPVRRLFQDPTNLAFVFDALVSCLQDTELPVRVWAALTLREFMYYPQVCEMLKPHVPSVMQVLLNLTNEIDMDTLSQTMESVAATFPEQLAPYAVQLGTQLCASFLRITQGLDVEVDDADEALLDEQCNKTMSAIGIMKTISTLIVSLDSSAQVMCQLEEVIMPILVETLGKSLLDLYDDAFEIVCSFTYCAKDVSPSMWKLLPLIYRAFKTDAYDYLEEMLPSLENYLHFGAKHFIGDRESQMCIIDIAQSILAGTECGEADYVRGCQLLQTFLLNLQGQLDEFIPQIVQLALGKLSGYAEFKTRSFKVHCTQIILCCIYNSPVSTFAALDAQSATAVFMQQLFLTQLAPAETTIFKRVYDKKLAILVICRIFDMQRQGCVPASLAPMIPEMFQAVLHVFSTFPKAIEERVKSIREQVEEDEDDETYGLSDEDDFKDLDDEEEGQEQEVDEKYLRLLQKQAQERALAGEDDAPLDGGDDSEDEWGVPPIDYEDPDQITAIDMTDPYAVFNSVFETLPLQDMANSLSQEQLQVLKTVQSTTMALFSAKDGKKV
ncbi:MAG: hypothetical protein SGCHY_004718 [Lobulomycetales sp.]